MKKNEISVNQADANKEKSIITFSLRTKTKRIYYHCEPYKTFTVEFDLGETFDEADYKAYYMIAENSIEWMVYFKKLMDLKRNNPAVLIRTRPITDSGPVKLTRKNKI